MHESKPTNDDSDTTFLSPLTSLFFFLYSLSLSLSFSPLSVAPTSLSLSLKAQRTRRVLDGCVEGETRVNISREGKHLDMGGAMGSACSSIAATRADGQRTDS